MNPNDYLLKFFAELERLVDGHGTRHAISTTSAGQLEVRLGAGNWYWAARSRSMTIRSGPHKSWPELKSTFPPASDRVHRRTAGAPRSADRVLASNGTRNSTFPRP